MTEATKIKKKKKPGCCSCCCLFLFTLLVLLPAGFMGFAYFYFKPLPSPLEQEYLTIPDYYPPPSKVVTL